MHRAPAKIILFGEHAVVYGQPAIAIPFTALHATADATPSPSGVGLTIAAHDIGQVLHVRRNDETPDNALTYAAQLTLARLAWGNRPLPDLNIDIRSTIPVSSGLGSGAAVSAALIRELSSALGSPLEGDDLNALVYEVEKMHHGTPSGIDNTVIVKATPVFFVSGKDPESFSIGRDLTFVIADSGIQGSTKETVGAVRELYEQHSETIGAFFDEIGALVREARKAIQQGNMRDIGQLMNRNHGLLKTLTVSCDPLDTLIGAARTAGALGAKLSGGGRGGNVIALVEPDVADFVSKAMREAGARRTWVTTLKATC